MKVVIPVLLVLSVVGGAAGFLVRESQPPEDRVTHRPIQATESEFTSSDGCRACHPSQYASWRASYHRTMTQVATPESVLADFDGTTVTQAHGRPMTLERRGREFWATFDDPDADAGNAPASDTRGVTLSRPGPRNSGAQGGTTE